MTAPPLSAARLKSGFKGYGLAVALVICALLLTLLVDPPQLASQIFLLAVILAAWVGGTGPGLLAALLATIALAFFFLPPIYSFAIHPREAPQLVVFFLVAGVVSWWSVARRRAEEALVRARDELEARVGERTAELTTANARLEAEIAERGGAEDALRYQTLLLKTVTDNASSMLYIVDAAGLGTFVNPALERITGYRAEELVGQVVHDKIHHTRPDGTTYPVCDCPLTGAVRTGKTVHGDDLFIRKDGTFFPVRYAASPVFHDGLALGTVIEVQDLTQIRAAEEELRDANMALARVNRVTTLGVLAASIAHEVNQPLGAMVTGAASCSRWLTAQPPDFERAQRALERIGQDGKRASEVIDRIRTLVKRQPPRRDRVDINEAILEVIALTRDEVQRNEIWLQKSLTQGLPPVEGDRVQLQQVIVNLIVNAIEAMSAVMSQRRKLTVHTAMGGANAVRVEVRDTGPGVDAARGDDVFESFYTTKAEGLGMGLSISRSIVEAHGGRLWVEANVPHGAAFQFTLPVGELAR